MTETGTDPLLTALAELPAPAPATLLDRVVSRWTEVPGPVDRLFVAFTDRGISYVRTAASVHGDAGEFRSAHRDRFGRPLRPADRVPAGLAPALRAHRGDGLTFDLSGLSPFERDVLTATARIPAGEIRPYAWVAAEIGRPRAVRAVGSALGRNPVPVLIPCHRVTRSGGELGEYVFGPTVKEALLRTEQVDLARVRDLARRRVSYVGSDPDRVFCFPTCVRVREVPDGRRRGFRGAADAVAAGYHPCPTCRPVPVGGPGGG